MEIVFTKPQMSILNLLEKLLDKDALDSIKKELNKVNKDEVDKIFKRIEKNLQYLTIIKQRGDHYHKPLISKYPKYLKDYLRVLKYVNNNPKNGLKAILPNLNLLDLSTNIKTIILLGDGHVLGPDFLRALVGNKTNLKKLLLDIVSEAKSFLLYKKIKIFTKKSKIYKNTALLDFIRGKVVILQTGDNIYPSIIEHFIFMCLKILSKNLFNITGDNDAFLVINETNLPNISDRIAAKIMKSAVIKQVFYSKNVFDEIKKEIILRPTSLIISDKKVALAVSHMNTYDPDIKNESKIPLTSLQEMTVTGILDQNFSKAEQNIKKLSKKLNININGWIHGSEASNKLRRIDKTKEISPGVFQIKKRVWIADNKQDPNEKTRSITLNIYKDFNTTLVKLLDYKKDNSRVKINP